MALFKIFRGPEAGLKSVPKHEGYAYFTEDEGNLYIDISSDDETTKGVRVQVNAKSAQYLKDSSDNLISVDDLFLNEMMAEVDQGGTGRDTLTVNAILIGNGTNAIKMVKIDDGNVIVGDSANGIKGVSGTGAFYAATANAPQFGTLPITTGGTGGATAADARINLHLYSKDEVDAKVSAATTTAYTTTLLADDWIQQGDIFEYNYINESLICATPPIVTCTDNIKEYSDIDAATTEATAKSGIIFRTSKKPSADISVIIIDNK